MDFTLECYPCLLQLVLKICALSQLNSAQSKQLMDEALRLLAAPDIPSNPPVITGKLFTFAHERFSPQEAVFDPFADLKRSSTALVLEHFAEFEKRVHNAPDHLEAAIRAAAAGNIIDFGATDHGSLNVEQELDTIDTLSFARYDIEPFRTAVMAARKVLYITDNAGEIVLDRLLLRSLRKLNPTTQLIIAVRGRPVLNDAVMEDALDAGIQAEGEIISSGSIYPGIVLEETRAAFKDHFSRADLIVCKGQGNFETMVSYHDKRMFFILRVKCSSVSGQTGVPQGSLVLMNGSAKTVDTTQ